MAYNIKTNSIYYPENYKIYFNNGVKAKFKKELYVLNNNILKTLTINSIKIIGMEENTVNA
jgi:hypothetical protein